MGYFGLMNSGRWTGPGLTYVTWMEVVRRKTTGPVKTSSKIDVGRSVVYMAVTGFREEQDISARIIKSCKNNKIISLKILYEFPKLLKIMN